MEEEIIIAKMYELANLIDYEVKNIIHLKRAMYCRKLPNQNNDGKNRRNYTNDRYATLGDTFLKFVLTEVLFDDENNYDKAQITQKRKELENNNKLYDLCNDCGIIKYAYHDTHFYNDAPKHNKVPHPKHDMYIEAIIGAIYKDRDFEYCKDWVIKFLQKNNYLPD